MLSTAVPLASKIETLKSPQNKNSGVLRFHVLPGVPDFMGLENAVDGDGAKNFASGENSEFEQRATLSYFQDQPLGTKIFLSFCVFLSLSVSTKTSTPTSFASLLIILYIFFLFPCFSLPQLCTLCLATYLNFRSLCYKHLSSFVHSLPLMPTQQILLLSVFPAKIWVSREKRCRNGSTLPAHVIATGAVETT